MEQPEGPITRSRRSMLSETIDRESIQHTSGTSNKSNSVEVSENDGNTTITPPKNDKTSTIRLENNIFNSPARSTRSQRSISLSNISGESPSKNLKKRHMSPDECKIEDISTPTTSSRKIKTVESKFMIIVDSPKPRKVKSASDGETSNLRRSRRLSSELSVVQEDPAQENEVEKASVTSFSRARRGKRLSVAPSQPSLAEEVEIIEKEVSYHLDNKGNENKPSSDTIDSSNNLLLIENDIKFTVENNVSTVNEILSNKSLNGDNDNLVSDKELIEVKMETDEIMEPNNRMENISISNCELAEENTDDGEKMDVDIEENVCVIITPNSQTDIDKSDIPKQNVENQLLKNDLSSGRIEADGKTNIITSPLNKSNRVTAKDIFLEGVSNTNSNRNVDYKNDEYSVELTPKYKYKPESNLQTSTPVISITKMKENTTDADVIKKMFIESIINLEKSNVKFFLSDSDRNEDKPFNKENSLNRDKSLNKNKLFDKVESSDGNESSMKNKTLDKDKAINENKPSIGNKILNEENSSNDKSSDKNTSSIENKSSDENKSSIENRTTDEDKLSIENGTPDKDKSINENKVSTGNKILNEENSSNNVKSSDENKSSIENGTSDENTPLIGNKILNEENSSNNDRSSDENKSSIDNRASDEDKSSIDNEASDEDKSSIGNRTSDEDKSSIENIKSVEDKRTDGDRSAVQASDDDNSDEDHSSEDDVKMFLDTGCEDAGDDYESGDSLDEFQRDEIEEHVIHERGESLNSDLDSETTYMSSDDTYEKDSFVCSDNEEDEELSSGTCDVLSSGEELNQSTTSKMKYDSKKRAIQKKASREMYEARHGNEKDLSLNNSGKNNFKQSDNSQNYKKEIADDDLKITGADPSFSGDDMTDAYGEELKRLCNINLNLADDESETESREEKKKNKECTTLKILDSSRDRRSTDRLKMNKSDDAASVGRNVGSDACGSSDLTVRSDGKADSEIIEESVKHMERLIHLNDSLSKVYCSLLKDMDNMKGKIDSDLVNVECRSVPEDRSEDVDGDGGKVKKATKRKHDREEGENEHRIKKIKYSTENDSDDAGDGSPPTFTDDRENVSRRCGNMDKKIKKDSSGEDSGGGVSKFRKLGDGSGFAVQNSGARSRRRVVSTSDFHVEDLSETRGDGVARCTTAAGEFTVTASRERGKPRLSPMSESTTRFTVVSLKREARAAVAVDRRVCAFADFKRDALYDGKIRRQPSGALLVGRRRARMREGWSRFC